MGPSLRTVAPCDLPVQLFATWTVLCHALVFLGARPAALLAGLFGLALAVIAGLALGLSRQGGWAALAFGLCDAAACRAEGSPPGGRTFRATAAALVAVELLLYLAGQPAFVLVSSAALGMLILSLVQFGAHCEQAGSPVPGAPALLLLMGLGCAGVTGQVSRPDIDDAFYLAVASSLARYPDLPLLSFDPIHGDPGIALQMAAYRVHSLELLAGVLSAWLGPWPIRFMHVVFPAVSALLLPFALFRLMREVAPRLALPAVALTLAVLIADGAARKSFGNFALVRLFQGKAIFVSVMVPLLLAYGIRLGRAPSKKRVWLLACAQVSAIGLTSTALPLAPLVSAIGVCVGLGPCGLRGVALRLCGLALSAAYPVFLAVLLYVQILDDKAGRLQGKALAQVAAQPGLTEGFASLPALLQEVLGKGPSFWAYVAACMLAPLVAPAGAARLAATASAFFLCVLGNPFLRPLIAQHVLGPSTYWRALWVVPFPALLAVSFLSLARPLYRRKGGTLALVVMLALGVVGLSTAGQRITLSESNGAKPTVLALKVGPEFLVARHAARMLNGGAGVVAVSGQVGRWLPAMPEAAYPLFVKPNYLRVADRPSRALLHACISGRRLPICTEAVMGRLLRNLSVREVVVARHAVLPALTRVLGQLGFQERRAYHGYRFWVAGPALVGH